jgi:glycolate oxidase FAD binding subunit
MAQITLFDGLPPLPLLRPTSVSEVGDAVRRSATDGSAIFPVGGRTQLHLGCPPDLGGRQGLVIDTGALDQVIDYPARDMTITVQTGITVARLGQILAPENQALPIDVPDADRATLGGILATNTSGSKRLGYGTLRDYLLGFTAVNDEGREFKAGGRVVKNVAGYDLCKLVVGSFGTLGIITQATLKLKPLPEEQAGVIVGCESDHLARTLDSLHASRTRPMCLDVLNRAGCRMLFQKAGLEAPTSPWTVLIGVEGSGEAVHWQVQQLVRELADLGPAVALQARVGCTNHPLCRALVAFPALEEATLTLKANLLPSGLADFCRAASEVGGQRSEIEPLLQAHAGNGIVLGHFLGDLTHEQAEAIVTSWRTLALKCQGSVVVTRCPILWKTPGFVWGPARGDFWLMRAVKERFDPRRIFNPGRFADGI